MWKRWWATDSFIAPMHQSVHCSNMIGWPLSHYHTSLELQISFWKYGALRVYLPSLCLPAHNGNSLLDYFGEWFYIWSWSDSCLLQGNICSCVSYFDKKLILIQNYNSQNLSCGCQCSQDELGWIANGLLVVLFELPGWTSCYSRCSC